MYTQAEQMTVLIMQFFVTGFNLKSQGPKPLDLKGNNIVTKCREILRKKARLVVQFLD